MANRSISTVFFDMDETLIEHTLSGPELMQRVRGQFGDELGEVDSARFGKVLRQKAGDLWNMMFEGAIAGDVALLYTFRNTLRALELDPDLAEPMRESFEALVLETTEPTPGVEAALEALRGAGITVGIITNGYTGLQSLKIGHHSLDDMVDHVFISEAMGAHKPDPAIFEAALGRVNATAERAMHVGDHLTNDVAGAIGVGMAGVLFDPRGDRIKGLESEPTGETPTHIIAELGEMAELAGISG